jgi:hypothetical protein
VPHSYDRSASFIRGRYGTEYLSVLRLIAFPKKKGFQDNPNVRTGRRAKIVIVATQSDLQSTDGV